MGLSNDTFLKSMRNGNTITKKDNVTVHWGKFIPNISKDLKGYLDQLRSLDTGYSTGHLR